MDRTIAAAAYTKRITTLVGHLAHSGLEVTHPLLQTHPEANSATLLVVAANRGLCGGYNSSILRLAYARWEELNNKWERTALEVAGKRGINAFRFRKIQPTESFTHFEDKPSFAEVDVLASRYLNAYVAGDLDRLDVVYTKFESLSRQHTVVETLLPLADVAGRHREDERAATPYEFLPSTESILEEVVPTSFRVRLFKCFLDAAVSEQIARMVAMKAATENADGMISHLSMAYNRARQGQITGELLEIIGGAEALNE